MPLAVQMDGYGPPEVLVARERAAVAPAAGEVVVRTVAAGVNRADCFIRSGEWPQAGGWPYVPGLEVAGVVARAGEGVALEPGTPVITMMQRLGGIHGARPGGYQEEVVVPASTLALLPDGLDPLTAATLGLPAVTALAALDALGVVAGHRVLVHAGSSAVGSVAIQLAVARGAEVVATGTSPSQFAMIRGCGASLVADTRDPAWPDALGRVDRVLDLVGAATFAASVHLLRPGGRLVFAGGLTGGDLSFSGWDLMRGITLAGWSSESLDRVALQQAVVALAVLHARGLVRPASLHTFPLARAAEAHAALEAGRLPGRTLLLA